MGKQRQYPTHPCEVCGDPTNNPKTCGRNCGSKLARDKSPNCKRGPRPHKRIPVEERIFRYIPERPENECWPWYGALNGAGKPYLWDSEKGSRVLGHRVTWQIFRGPIPDGHVVSQSCQQTFCTNPKHLVCGPRGKTIGRRLRLSGQAVRWGETNSSARLSNVDAEVLRKFSRERRFDDITEFAKAKGISRSHALSVGRSRGLGRDPTRYVPAAIQGR